MSVFSLDRSFERAADRLQATSPRRRSDRGKLRLHPEVTAKLHELLLGQERPPVRQILRDLRDFCQPVGLKAPARATVYQAMAQLPATSFIIEKLPEHPRATLYNLNARGQVPGHQLAFYCLNYGGSQAISFAAGLPWLALHQAARLPGWRPRSRGLLEAILRVRGIA